MSGDKWAAHNQALIEALPFVNKWRGENVVVKYGGAAMIDTGLIESFVQDVVLLQKLGIKLFVVHGGGSSITRLSNRLDIKVQFTDGQRHTCRKTMYIAQMVQVGGINVALQGLIAEHGARAIGLPGQALGGWLRAERRQHEHSETGELVDLGLVGSITEIDGDALLKLAIESDVIPVIPPIAVDANFEPLNINADNVAATVAGALSARLLYLTDVKGIQGSDGQFLSECTIAEVQQMLESQVITGGMRAKAEACITASQSGAMSASVVDGRVPHVLLKELLTDEGSGTIIT